MNGRRIKIELIIEKILQNFDKYIIYSDATIYINNNNLLYFLDYLEHYKKYDLVFPNNNIKNDKFNHLYNIGFILIKCNKNTLNFFEKVKHELNLNKDWDQNVINNLLLYNNILNIGCFDNKIYCGYDFNNKYKNDFFIFKSFIRHTNDINNNLNQRLFILKKNDFNIY